MAKAKPDPATVRHLKDDEGKSFRAIAKRLGSNYAAVNRAYQSATANGASPSQSTSEPDESTLPIEAVRPMEHPSEPTTTLQRVELVGEPVSVDADDRDSTVDLKTQLDALAAEVADLKAHRLEVDAWIAIQHTRPVETAQPHAALRSAETRSLAHTYAELPHTWDDPEDAKSVPFNLSLPRGLKRLLDAEAKRSGFPASRLVQKLLMAALVGEGVRDE